MGFSLNGRERDVLVDGVAKFKYLGQTLEQTYDDWMLVRQNIKQLRRVWGRLGNMPQR